MKKFLFLLTNFFIVSLLHAQTKPPQNFYDSLFSEKRFPSQKFKWNDSITNELRKKLFSNETLPPGSLRKGFVYLGNNQNGFDVYQTMQDNMYILKPDSTFVSNMPVLKLSLEEKPISGEKKK